MAFTLHFLSDSGKVNSGRVYMPAEVYCLFKVLWLWVMALNDYLDALLQGYCSAPASKQACSCLFEFSILYCHVSFACLQLMPSDWSFPSAFLLPRACCTHTHRRRCCEKETVPRDTVCESISEKLPHLIAERWLSAFSHLDIFTPMLMERVDCLNKRKLNEINCFPLLLELHIDIYRTAISIQVMPWLRRHLRLTDIAFTNM